MSDREVPGAEVARRAGRTTALAIAAANATGALVVACFSILALPKPEIPDEGNVVLINVLAAAAYLIIALVVGVAWGRRRLEDGPHGTRAWLDEDRPPDAEQRLHVLRTPARIMTVEAVLWGIATVGFTLLNASFSGLLGLGVGLTVALGGMTTSAASYLLCELALQPIAARALAAGAVERRGVPGVATRWLLAWALGTGVPIVGLVLVGVVALTSVSITERALAVTAITLSVFGLAFGALVSLLAAYATVHPITSIRDGLARVRAGDLDVRLEVWDSTEMGLLQAGFNDMVAGLREREHMRDVFGRQVGEDVARRALSEEVGLGGEVRDVAVLFVDLVGSTTLATELSPEEVVALLNRFFAEVVDIVETSGGWINKFEGDAALAIFGAPVAVDDAPGSALRAARLLDERLREEIGELTAAIGVAFGPAVAGNIGAERRFEYTVIGDPVNVAARLTELAKERPRRVLATAEAVAAADPDEAAHWNPADEVTLRGRPTPTRLASPR